MYRKLLKILEDKDAFLITSPHELRYFTGFSGGEGMAVIGKEDEFISIITQRGLVKKCETKYFGTPLKRSSTNSQAYLTTLETADEITNVLGLQKDSGIAVCTRTEVIHLKADDIPNTTRKAKGKKLISLPSGTNILNVFEEEKVK